MTKIKNNNKKVISTRLRIWIRTRTNLEYYQEIYYVQDPNQKHEQAEWFIINKKIDQDQEQEQENHLYNVKNMNSNRSRSRTLSRSILWSRF